MGIIDGLVEAFSRGQDEYLKATEIPAPEIPENLNPTEKKLASMFMEHIPTNILDSGGSLGYTYQRNRKNPVWKQRYAWLEGFIDSDNNLRLRPIVSTFHSLTEMLVYLPEYDQGFQSWLNSLECKDEYFEYLENFIIPGKGVSYKHWLGEYTYNYDNMFSQDFIWYMINPQEHYDIGYSDNVAIIQLHNGCDARGGFTEPVLFIVKDEYCSFWQETAYIECPKCHSWWDVWISGASEDPASYYPVKQNNVKALYDYPCEKGEQGKKDVIVVNEKGQVFCPICGEGCL